MARRRRGVPQVIAYWWKSPSTARGAASSSSRGGGEVPQRPGGRGEFRPPRRRVAPAVLVDDAGHLADDRLGEALDAPGDAHRGPLRDHDVVLGRVHLDAGAPGPPDPAL